MSQLTQVLENKENINDDCSCMYPPMETWIQICEYLDIKDVLGLCIVCKDFHDMFMKNVYLWKKIAQRQLPNLHKYKPQQKSYRWLCIVGSKPPATTGTDHDKNKIYGETNESGKAHGIVIQVESNCGKYGEFKDGKVDGKAGCRWSNGNLYTGDWKNNRQSGEGEFTWSDGDHYIGSWVDDQRQGEGTYTWPDKSSCYKGTFDKNELEGFGRYTWKHGYYEGSWKQSIRHGTGEILWKNGNSFKGNFENNKKSGYGEYKWSDGSFYYGDWKDDERSGNAIAQWENGVTYKGQYENDLRNGQGTLEWSNGDKFIGSWKNGGRFGKGTFTASGETKEQEWKVENEPENIKYSQAVPAREPQEPQLKKIKK